MPHHDDAADRFAFAVPFGDAAAHLRPDVHVGDVTEQDGRAGGVHAEGDRLQILRRVDGAEPPDHQLPLRRFQDASAHIAVAALHGAADLGDRNAEGAQAVGVDPDLVLAHEPADAGHFRDAGHAGQFAP